MINKMGEWLILPVLGILALNGLMYFMQPGMIFFPWRSVDATPSDWGLAYDDVAVRTDDGVALHGWYIPREGARRVVLFLHGNAGNISHRRESIEIFHRLGTDVFIFDYRGYGQSGGSPSEAGLYRDAAAAWRYLTDVRGRDPAQIVIFGRSLGGAVAARLASEVTAGGVILESTFNSARDFAHTAFPLLSRLVILRYEFDAARTLAHTRSPVLILHSPNDEIMPFELGRRLYQAAPEPRRFVTLRGDHNTGFMASRPAYDRALQEFLESLPAAP
jgi:fermentation-respiration switch protein FrsA (DUF1100 family)